MADHDLIGMTWRLVPVTGADAYELQIFRYHEYWTVGGKAYHFGSDWHWKELPLPDCRYPNPILIEGWRFFHGQADEVIRGHLDAAGISVTDDELARAGVYPSKAIERMGS